MNAFHRSYTRPQNAGPAPSAADRRARNLDFCEELIHRGMALARAASDRAMDDAAAPPPVARIPGSAAAEIAQLKEELRRRGPDYGKLFTHLTRAIRLTMLLETFLAEGHVPEPPGAHTTSQHPTTQTAQSPRPHRETLRRETLERLDCALDSIDPDDTTAVEDLLRDIAQKFGMDLDAEEPPPSPASRKNPDQPEATRTPRNHTPKNPPNHRPTNKTAITPNQPTTNNAVGVHPARTPRQQNEKGAHQTGAPP